MAGSNVGTVNRDTPACDSPESGKYDLDLTQTLAVYSLFFLGCFLQILTAITLLSKDNDAPLWIGFLAFCGFGCHAAGAFFRYVQINRSARCGILLPTILNWSTFCAFIGACAAYFIVVLIALIPALLAVVFCLRTRGKRGKLLSKLESTLPNGLVRWSLFCFLGGVGFTRFVL